MTTQKLPSLNFKEVLDYSSSSIKLYTINMKPYKQLKSVKLFLKMASCGQDLFLQQQHHTLSLSRNKPIKFRISSKRRNILIN
jgi:hypothetical protein